jgi:hypothetical protein
VLASTEEKTVPAPKAKRKWLTASVVEDASTVVGQIFDEAQRRDPNHERTLVALVDGNNRPSGSNSTFAVLNVVSGMRTRSGAAVVSGLGG